MATEALVLEEAPLPQPGRLASAHVHTSRPRLDLAGVLIDHLDLPGAVERIGDFLSSGSSHQVITVNLDFLSIAERDPRFRQTINQADLAVADGMPLVWLSRLRGEPLAERIAGVELVDESCRLAARMGRGAFLLGAAPGVAAAAAQSLVTRHPGLRIAGVYSPPFGPLPLDEDERIVQMIREATPDLLFVALGAPRQDLWIRDHLDRLDVPVAMGVGCVLDLLAGTVTRAPSWMQHAGLEWAYRLAREPQRLWRRYLVDDIPMLGRLVLDSMRDGRSEVVVPRPAARPPG
jgi:N-acetylglucosaminyldiphosphoundecaprenol N-acetyl-beta-D-mannosaminyltransferase